ncbi:hypothetical protein RFI_22659, partial [Reticulomyxa filosa]
GDPKIQQQTKQFTFDCVLNNAANNELSNKRLKEGTSINFIIDFFGNELFCNDRKKKLKYLNKQNYIVNRLLQDNLIGRASKRLQGELQACRNEHGQFKSHIQELSIRMSKVCNHVIIIIFDICNCSFDINLSGCNILLLSLIFCERKQKQSYINLHILNESKNFNINCKVLFNIIMILKTLFLRHN